jgi:hypothetical protein
MLWIQLTMRKFEHDVLHVFYFVAQKDQSIKAPQLY